MNLNSIKLEPTDISLLYKNTLVEVEINADKQSLPQTNTNTELIIPDNHQGDWNFLGENKKKILVVVHYPDVVHIPDKQLSFLTKLLAACNLNLGDAAILNFQNQKSSDFNKVINFFTPKVVLLFKIEPGEFGMPMIFPHFQVQGYKDAVFVASPALDEIEPDKILKSKLWVCLKKIFNL